MARSGKCVSVFVYIGDKPVHLTPPRSDTGLVLYGMDRVDVESFAPAAREIFERIERDLKTVDETGVT